MSYPTLSPCSDYTDCGATISASTSSENQAWGHNITNSIGSDTSLYQLKTSRIFSVSFGWARSSRYDRFYIDRGNAFPCSSSLSANPSSNISEDCSIFKRIPYYLDRTQGISVYKETLETLKFNISSTKTAVFRQAYGNMAFHKILIKDNVKVNGSEKFILNNNGIETVLAEVTYEFNPFPPTGRQMVYGLNGENITQDTRYGVPEPNVVQVICLPLPPSLGIPMDADIANYGFYDYLALAEGSGGQFSDLARNDGGLDFFYPEWCRNMTPDPIWQETRTRRFESNFPGYGVPKPDLLTNAPWNPPAPETYCWPFGSFTKDALGNFIYSCLLEFSDKAGGSKKIVHYSSFGDLKKAIFTDNSLQINTNWIITPTSPL